MNTSHLETLQNLATFTSVWSLQTSNPAPMFLQYQMIHQKMNCSKVCVILDLKMIKDSEFSQFFPLQRPWRAVLFLKCCRGDHLNQSYDTGKAWKSGKTTMDGKELGCSKNSRNTWAKYWSFHFLVVVNKTIYVPRCPLSTGITVMCCRVAGLCWSEDTCMKDVLREQGLSVPLLQSMKTSPLCTYWAQNVQDSTYVIL